MSISSEIELAGMRRVAEAVALTLKKMRNYAAPMMSAKELDEYGGSLLTEMGARSAPYETYGFPGWTCISVNHEAAHGIPSANKILQEGDLINIDVSAELDGYWADNGGSFVLSADIHGHQRLVNSSKEILRKAINSITSGARISDLGHLIETNAKGSGFKVIRNLAGHGIGRGLHEAPDEIFNFKQKFDRRRFKKNSVVAIETFISSASTAAVETGDGWTLVGNKGGFVAQHEHTIVVTEGRPIILTEMNGVWD